MQNAALNIHLHTYVPASIHANHADSVVNDLQNTIMRNNSRSLWEFRKSKNVRTTVMSLQTNIILFIWLCDDRYYSPSKKLDPTSSRSARAATVPEVCKYIYIYIYIYIYKCKRVLCFMFHRGNAITIFVGVSSRYGAAAMDIKLLLHMKLETRENHKRGAPTKRTLQIGERFVGARRSRL